MSAKSRKKIICIASVLLIACVVALYPLYIKWLTGRYAKQFAEVFSSHNVEEWDKLFGNDTVFEWENQTVIYSDIRTLIEDKESFTCEYSYGHLHEETNVYLDNEYMVSLMLPIESYNDGTGIRRPGSLEGEFVLARKGPAL